MVRKNERVGKNGAESTKARSNAPARAKTSTKKTAEADTTGAMHRMAEAPDLIVKSGARPHAQTIVYIHGIGNKPPAAVLKCQWDNALFGVELGDRSRLAYWVNRMFYPAPSDESCTAADTVHVDDDQMTTKAVLALSRHANANEGEALDAEIDSLADNDNEKRVLSNIATEMQHAQRDQNVSYRALDVEAKFLPLPPFMRRMITQITTRAFMRDVHEFFFNDERRDFMQRSLLERLEAGGGPFIVIGHSQGSMIAYNVLRTLTKAQCDVPLFITIGSPLGLSEVKDVLGQWNGENFAVPPCVTRWINVADPMDPVAADKGLANEYPAGPGQTMEDYLVINPDSPRHPHSGTGYLRTAPVQDEIRKVIGNAFSQPVGKAIIARDLVQEIENSVSSERHPTLIQLSTSDMHDSVEHLGQRLVSSITDMIRSTNGDGEKELQRANIEPLKRYVSASLTRKEIELLRTHYSDLHIERVWRNAEKRALLNQSGHTIQCTPAVAGYGANGHDIGWAVLDTGIRGDHPHFERHHNIKGQWDCTQPGKPIVHAAGSPGSNTLDRQGHGTHVAGIIAGEYRFATANGSDPDHLSGMAPQTNLYGFKVLDDRGNGNDAWIIKALDAIAELNEHAGRLIIAGINLSLGGNFDPSVYGCGHSPLCQELRRLWGQGVLICLAAGNQGYALLQAAHGAIPSNMDLSIGDPANLEEAIAVGSIHKSNPHTYGVSYFSSRGPTADGRVKPDLVAPGERILSALHDIRLNGTNATIADLYVEMSGTSMAAPHVSGLLAGFLSERREFIGYPTRVKEMLLGHCTSLNRDRYVQGAGMPNLIRMLSNT